MRTPLHPSRGRPEQMAPADTGWGVFLRLTQVSGTARAGVPCQLRCIEDRCLSVRSSLTPRSVSSGPPSCRYSHSFFLFFFFPAGTEIEKRGGNKKWNRGCDCKPRDCMQMRSYRCRLQTAHRHKVHYHTASTPIEARKPIYPHTCKIKAV